MKCLTDQNNKNREMFPLLLRDTTESLQTIKQVPLKKVGYSMFLCVILLHFDPLEQMGRMSQHIVLLF